MKPTRSWCLMALRLGFAALFASAALPKLADPAAFARDLEAYRLLPPLGVYLTALSLPWLELLVAAVLLFLPRFRLGAWAISVVLLAVFVVALGSAASRGLDIHCGCFGGKEPVGTMVVIIRALLLALTSLALLLEQRAATGERTR